MNKPTSAQEHYSLGCAYVEKNMLEDAIACFQQALSIQPAAEVYYNLAVTQERIGNLTDAIYSFQEALRLRPDLKVVHLLLGNLFLRTDNFQKAIDNYTVALSEDRNNAEIHNNLGIALKKSNRLKEAAEDFRKALRINSDYDEAYVNLGIVLSEQGKPDEAITCYKKALSINPLSSEAHFNLANAHFGKKSLEEGIQSLQASVKIAPRDIRFSDRFINILDCYMPNIETNCPYIKAQKSLQQISTEDKSTLVTADETVRQLYQQCQSILTLHKLDINTGESQIFRGAFNLNNCHRHKIVFNTFNIIPEYCFSCYKVTIEPRTVMELFKLLFVFDKLKLPNNNHRKCIIEVRPEVSGKYKGFIYCRSLDEGKEILNIVQSILDETIDKGIPIFIKRGCTEFPVAYPAYGQITDNKIQQMTYNEDWRKHEAFADKNLLTHADNDNPFNLTCDHPGFTLRDALVMRDWLIFAKKRGDSTYLNII